MKRLVGSLLTLTVLVSACDASSTVRSPAGVKRATHSPKPAATTAPNGPSVAPSASSPGSPAPMPAPSLSPQPSFAPIGPSSLLSGLAQIDASYALSVGAGHIIAAGSGNIIAAGSGNIIAAGSGNIIAAGSGNIIAAGSGNIIAAGSGNIISSNNAGIIAAGAGNIISSNNAGIIAAGAHNYRVADASAPAPGKLLPVKGMIVVPISLITGQPLGPAVVTDERGNYTVSVPKDQANNVLILAALPGQNASDPIVQDARLQYRQIISADSARQHPIDEDANITTEYLVTSLALRLDTILTSEDSFATAQSLITGWSAPSFVRDAVLAGLVVIRKQAKANGIDKLSPADQMAFSRNLLAFLLAKMNPLDSYTTKSLLYPSYTGPEESATGAMTSILKAAREGGTSAWLKAGADPGYFDKKPYVVAANQARAALPPAQGGPLPPYHLAKPADLGSFIVNEYLGKNSTTAVSNVGIVLTDLGAQFDADLQVKEEDRLNIAAISILVAFVSTLVPLPIPIYAQPNLAADVNTYIATNLLKATANLPAKP